MKHRLLVALALALAAAASAWPASSTAPATPAASVPRTNAIHPGLFELGLNLGIPSGLSIKLWLDRTSALEAIAAWDFTQAAVTGSVDYLFAFPDIIKVQAVSFPLFVGIGGVFGVAGTGSPTPLTIGLRVPLGILFVFAKVPLEISVDAVPVLDLFPSTSVTAMGGLAVRWCF